MAQQLVSQHIHIARSSKSSDQTPIANRLLCLLPCISSPELVPVFHITSNDLIQQIPGLGTLTLFDRIVDIAHTSGEILLGSTYIILRADIFYKYLFYQYAYAFVSSSKMFTASNDK